MTKNLKTPYKGQTTVKYFLVLFVISFFAGYLFLTKRTSLESLINKINAPKINYNFSGASPVSGYKLSNENKVYGFKVLLSKSNNNTLPSGRFEVNGDWVDFSLSPASANLKKTQYKKTTKDGKDIVLWEDAIPWTDISYRMKEDGLKEEIIIKDKALALSASQNHDPLNISFDLVPQGVFPRMDLSGKLSSFKDSKTGEYRFHFEKPFLVDAKGKKYEWLEYTLTTVENGKTKSYTFVFTLPREWLIDPSRVYPVTLDQTILRNEQKGLMQGL